MLKEEQVVRVARTQSGITLHEIMNVLANIGLVMCVLVGPKVYRSFSEARIKTAFLMLKEYDQGYTRWISDNDGEDCPPKLDDLIKYTNKKDMKDPWGSQFMMKCGDAPTENHFGVISFGPDKKEGTEDDIHSWDAKPKI